MASQAARTQYYSRQHHRWMDYGTLMTVEAAGRVVQADIARQKALNGKDAERYRVDVIEVSAEVYRQITAA